jgi:hypothetical protein
MYGLKIVNPVHWRASWSAEIGRRLAVKDSSYDLFVFEPGVDRNEVLDVLRDVPAELYQLLDVSPTESDQCEIWTDQGHCYREGD